MIDALVDEELSIGDYVLTGGEIAALVVIDAAARLLPGVLGDEESAYRDSFGDGLLDHPHYTRPAEFRGMKVPEVLLSAATMPRSRSGGAAKRSGPRSSSGPTSWKRPI